MTRTIDIPIDVMSAEEFENNRDELLPKLYKDEDVETFLRVFLMVRYLAQKFRTITTKPGNTIFNTSEIIHRVMSLCAWDSGHACSTLFMDRVLHSKLTPSTATIIESVYKLYSIYMHRVMSSMVEGIRSNFEEPYYGHDVEHDETCVVFIPPFKKEHFPEELRYMFDIDPTEFALPDNDTSAPSIDGQFYLESMFFKERT